MFDTNYNRKIAEQVRAINQKYIDDSDAKEQLYDKVIPSFQLSSGRGMRKVHREEAIEANMEPNIIPPKKRGRKPKAGGAMSAGAMSAGAMSAGAMSAGSHCCDGEMDMMGSAMSAGARKYKKLGSAMSAGVMSAGKKRGRPAKKGSAMSAGAMSAGAMSAGVMSAGVMSAGKKRGRPAKKGSAMSAGVMNDEMDMMGSGWLKEMNPIRWVSQMGVKKGGRLTEPDPQKVNAIWASAKNQMPKASNMIKSQPATGSGKGKTPSKITPKQRGAMVSAYMKKYNVKLGEASKAVSAYLKGDKNSLEGGAFKWLKHLAEGVGNAVVDVGKTAVGMVAKNPELLALAI
jgi:hypothetical protein